jgi:biopolymer transport protein TolR
LGASLNTGGGGGSGRRGRRRAKRAPMSEINVTPMVDVMLVLLIIFMVAAPLLTVGVPIELPQAKGKQLEPKGDPLVISIKANGEVAIAEALVPLSELVAKLKALSAARKGEDEPVFVRGDKGVNYGTVMKIMGRISAGGFKKVSLVTEVEEGG